MTRWASRAHGVTPWASRAHGVTPWASRAHGVTPWASRAHGVTPWASGVSTPPHSASWLYGLRPTSDVRRADVVGRSGGTTPHPVRSPDRATWDAPSMSGDRDARPSTRTRLCGVVRIPYAHGVTPCSSNAHGVTPCALRVSTTPHSARELPGEGAARRGSCPARELPGEGAARRGSCPARELPGKGAARQGSCPARELPGKGAGLGVAQVRPGIHEVPASGTPAIAAASIVSATRSSGSRLCTLDFPQARASVVSSIVSAFR